MEGLSGVMVKPTIDEAIKKIQDRFVTPEVLNETVQRLQMVEERVAKIEEQDARTMQEIARVAELEERILRLEPQHSLADIALEKSPRNGSAHIGWYEMGSPSPLYWPSVRSLSGISHGLVSSPKHLRRHETSENACPDPPRFHLPAPLCGL